MSGAAYFLDLLDFDTHLADCDLVVTGESQMDDQTMHGKLPAVVVDRASAVPVVAVVGRNDAGTRTLRTMGINAVYALTDLTDGDPATDPGLSRQLLEQLGRTVPLGR